MDDRPASPPAGSMALGKSCSPSPELQFPHWHTGAPNPPSVVVRVKDFGGSTTRGLNIVPAAALYPGLSLGAALSGRVSTDFPLGRG